MDYVLFFFRLVYRVRAWLILGSMLCTLLAIIWSTQHSRLLYRVESTIYTGIESGYNKASKNDERIVIDNLINIIKSESTLKRVSYRLYARSMIHGNLEKDNQYISAAHFREIHDRTKNNRDGQTLMSLIDRNSESETVRNMEKYERPTRDNFIYGLFYFTHPLFSHQALNKIRVERKGNSDLLQVVYTTDDPAIAYHTIDILTEEFVNEYRAIRFGETDKVINDFRRELNDLSAQLRNERDSLAKAKIDPSFVVNVNERHLQAIQQSYNDALLRKKNLEMTSAIIKVLNPPAFPIGPEPQGRKRIAIATAVVSFFSILLFFLFLEIVDRTLRDRIRAGWIIGARIWGAFPGPPPRRFQPYIREYQSIACKYMSTVVMSFYKPYSEKRPFIINFLSIESGEGKTFLSTRLEEHWRHCGLKVRRIAWESDFDINDKRYLFADSILEVSDVHHDDIVIVEHPSLNANTVPNRLLQEADVNLLIVRANRAWQVSDRIIYTKLKEQVESPIVCYLNLSSLQSAEDYMGMLPPYTNLRTWSYRISKLGLREQSVREEIAYPSYE